MTDGPGLACEDVLGLAPLFVLDALDAVEAAGVRAHLATCPAAHPEVAELGGVAAMLVDSLEPREPPAAVGERIRQAVQADLRARARDDSAAARLVGGYERAVPPASLPPAAAVGPAEGRAPRRAHPAWRRAVEAAALVALVVVIGWNVVLQGQVDAARRQATLLGQALAVAVQPGSVTAALTGSGAASGAAGFVVAGGRAGDYLFVTGLPDPGAGRTYQAWFLIASQAVSAGLVTLGPDRVTVASVTAAAGPFTALTLTIEPAGGSSQPTSAPVAQATFSG